MATRIARREGTGMEGMRLSVLSEWLGARSLALVPPGETVLIADIGLEEAERSYAPTGFERGALARCEANRGAHVTVRLANGHTVELPPEHAWFVQVTAPPAGSRVNRTVVERSRLQ
jgi:hypothetical protein